MVPALLITVLFAFLFWLVFFRLRLIQFSIAWGVVSAFFVAHVLLIFLIGLRFVTPYSTDATVIQHTIQLIPRLAEPTLVTAVLVEPNVPVKKDQPLFQFDRRPYEYKVRQLEAQLAQARQNVRVLKADWDVALQKVVQARSELGFAKDQQQRAQVLAQQGAGPLPSGVLPKFNPPPPQMPQGRFAVRIALHGADQSKFPIGAQGAAAIYTAGGGFAVLRR